MWGGERSPLKMLRALLRLWPTQKRTKKTSMLHCKKGTINVMEIAVAVHARSRQRARWAGYACSFRQSAKKGFGGLKSRGASKGWCGNQLLRCLSGGS